MDIQLLGLGTIVVERVVEDGVNVLPLGLPHASHVDEDEVVGVHVLQRGTVFGNHGAVHGLIQRHDFLTSLHRVSG